MQKSLLFLLFMFCPTAPLSSAQPILKKYYKVRNKSDESFTLNGQTLAPGTNLTIPFGETIRNSNYRS